MYKIMIKIDFKNQWHINVDHAVRLSTTKPVLITEQPKCN